MKSESQKSQTTRSGAAASGSAFGLQKAIPKKFKYLKQILNDLTQQVVN